MNVYLMTAGEKAGEGEREERRERGANLAGGAAQSESKLTPHARRRMERERKRKKSGHTKAKKRESIEREVVDRDLLLLCLGFLLSPALLHLPLSDQDTERNK